MMDRKKKYKNTKQGGLAGVKRRANVRGQEHMLAYITEEEADTLRKRGGGIGSRGQQVTGPGGIPAFPPGAGQSSDPGGPGSPSDRGVGPSTSDRGGDRGGRNSGRTSGPVSPGGMNTEGRAGPVSDRSTPPSPGGMNVGGSHSPAAGEVTGPADRSATEGHPAKDTTRGTPGVKDETAVAETVGAFTNEVEGFFDGVANTLGMSKDDVKGVMANVDDFSRLSPSSLQDRGFISDEYSNAATGYNNTDFGMVDRTAAVADAAMQNQSTISKGLEVAAGMLDMPSPSMMRSAVRTAGPAITGAIEDVTNTTAERQGKQPASKAPSHDRGTDQNIADAYELMQMQYDYDNSLYGNSEFYS